MSASIHVEVVYALPERQWSVGVELPEGSGLGAALEAASTAPGFSALDLTSAPVGIWGQAVSDRARVLRDGDRVEIYRPLRVDPMLARRQREAAFKA